MKILFTTLGCKLNFAESSALGKSLMQRGHVRAKQGEQADVCIINTCSVTDAADHKDRQAIHRIRRQNPDAVLIVTGCYAQLKPGEVANLPEVDYVLGMNEKFAIPELVERLECRVGTDNKFNAELLLSGEHPAVSAQTTGVSPGTTNSTLKAEIYTSEIRTIDEFHAAHSKDDRTRCFLKVQDGCNYFCTYCTIPLARGKSRNPSIASVVADARQALAEGAKEIVLTGVNIGDFGRSTGESFFELVQAIDQIEGEFRVRISSCEPNLLSDAIIDFVAQSRHFAPHFHIPLQSGSNEVLQIMHRRYTRELFAERVEHIHRVMPNAFIGVDCMVGVRGETEECWNDYLQFIERLPVSQLHVFTYSERANTRMLGMDLFVVPPKEREHRSRVLHEVSVRKLSEFYAAHAGESATVLWESKRIKDPQNPSCYLMEGFTENYIRQSCPYDKAKVNTYENILINN